MRRAMPAAPAALASRPSAGPVVRLVPSGRLVSQCCSSRCSPRAPPATSAPGLGSPLPHLRRDWAHPCPHLRRDSVRPARVAVRVQPLLTTGTPARVS